MLDRGKIRSPLPAPRFFFFFLIESARLQRVVETLAELVMTRREEGGSMNMQAAEISSKKREDTSRFTRVSIIMRLFEL